MALPRFYGTAGSLEAAAQGLRTAHRLQHEGRKLRPGAQPKGLYLMHETATKVFPLYALDDTEPQQAGA